jgi:hypothetical protein
MNKCQFDQLNNYRKATRPEIKLGISCQNCVYCRSRGDGEYDRLECLQCPLGSCFSVVGKHHVCLLFKDTSHHTSH